jgi:NTE family protein
MSTENKQRALILQGKGALGAYEAGAFKALYEIISEEDKKNGINNGALFDVVVGTSMGAITAAVLVSHVIERGWQGSAEKLIDFWKYLADDSSIDIIPGYKQWWDYLHSIDPNIASGEEAIKHYSAKKFSVFGIKNVFQPVIPLVDSKFLDLQNTWSRYDNTPLKESLEKYAKFPIATSFHLKQPRLLLVSVDVEKGIPVIFDSYEKEDGQRKSVYEDHMQEDRYGKDLKHEYIIKYTRGIMIEHVMASSSVPLNFDYALVPVEYDYAKSSQESGASLKDDLQKNNLHNYRRFWDGGILNNTPIRELIQAHQDYWKKVRHATSIPNLSVCIINTWLGEDSIPHDHDGIIDRKYDIMFHGKTPYDKKVALLITDYIRLTNDLIDLAKRKGATIADLETVLRRETQSFDDAGMTRTYEKLLEEQLRITRVLSIQREDKYSLTSDQMFQFSISIISEYIKQGFRQALKQIKDDMLYKNGGWP